VNGVYKFPRRGLVGRTNRAGMMSLNDGHATYVAYVYGLILR